MNKAKQFAQSCGVFLQDVVTEPTTNYKKHSSSRIMLVLGGISLIFLVSVSLLIMTGITLSVFGVFPEAFTWQRFEGPMKYLLGAIFGSALPYISKALRGNT